MNVTGAVMNDGHTVKDYTNSVPVAGRMRNL